MPVHDTCSEDETPSTVEVELCSVSKIGSINATHSLSQPPVFTDRCFVRYVNMPDARDEMGVDANDDNTELPSNLMMMFLDEWIPAMDSPSSYWM